MGKTYSSKAELVTVINLPTGWPRTWPWIKPNGGPPWPPGPLPPGGPWPIPPIVIVIPQPYALDVSISPDAGPSTTPVTVTAQVNDSDGVASTDLNNYKATISATDVNNAVHQIKKVGGSFANSIEYRITGSTIVETVVIGTGIDLTDITFNVDVQPIVGGLSDTAAFSLDESLAIVFIDWNDDLGLYNATGGVVNTNLTAAPTAVKIRVNTGKYTNAVFNLLIDQNDGYWLESAGGDITGDGTFNKSTKIGIPISSDQATDGIFVSFTDGNGARIIAKLGSGNNVWNVGGASAWRTGFGNQGGSATSIEILSYDDVAPYNTLISGTIA